MSESERVETSVDAAEAESTAAGPTTAATTAALPPRDRSILDFERDWQRHGEAKLDAVQSEFGLNSARYYQILNRIIDSPAALAYDPMLVRRLQRVRDSKASARTLQSPHHTAPSRHS